MSDEPVKVKMQLHAARPSIQGAVASTPAVAAAVEAVEARWRVEDKKERAALFRKRISSCLAWLFLLLVALLGIWYFAGDNFLPPEYTFKRARTRIKVLLGQNQEDESMKQEDPADVQTAAERAQMANFVSQLERLCASGLQNRNEPIKVKVDAWLAGKAMLNEIVSADNWYFKARQKLAEMEGRNKQLDKQRAEETNAKSRRFANQYNAEMLQQQKNIIDKKLDDCKRVRVQVVQRAIKAVKSASVRWTGPVSRNDVAQLLVRLEKLAKKNP